MGSSLETRLNDRYKKITSPDGGIVVTPRFCDRGKDVAVYTSIEAPKRGNEALNLLADNLQSIADTVPIRVVHIGNPTHQVSIDLFRHNPHYRQDDITTQFVRVFTPK